MPKGGAAMRETFRLVIPALVIAIGANTLPARAQELRELKASPVRSALSLCGFPVPPPSALPPRGSGPVVYQLAPCFERQAHVSRINADQYLRDIHLRPSRPSEGQWVPYDAAAERAILEDFQRLWKAHALADLSVEVQDYQFSNGVVGKLVAYHITEQDQ
jgi:hypothetical protein